MARATTKKDLSLNASIQYDKLVELINTLSNENQRRDFIYDVSNETAAHWQRDKNIKDVLIHLYEWHKLLINWVQSNTKGLAKAFLIEPYNWKTTKEMNEELYNRHQSTKYDEATVMLNESHNEVISMISNFSNEELFEKGSFNWTGGSTLGQYCVSVTSSHYDWAIKKIKKHIKSLKEAESVK